MGIPLLYEDNGIDRQVTEDTYFEVGKITPIQLKKLIATSSAVPLNKEGLLLYVREINDSKVRIPMSLSAYIVLYNTFKNDLELVNKDKRKKVTINDLYRFIF